MNRLKDKNLSHFEKILMIYIDEMRSTDECYLILSLVSKELNCSQPTVINSISSLETKGYLEREGKKFKILK